MGNVDQSGQLLKSGETLKGVLPEDNPKVRVTFDLRKNPYSQTLVDQKPVIDWVEQADGTRIYDQLLIQVESERLFVVGVEHQTQRTGGRRGQTFTYHVATYYATPIENLTHPDRTFEYE